MDKLPKNVMPMETMSDLKKYKTRMTEVRKKNLREGLNELYKRKEVMSRRIAQRSENKQQERERLIGQAEREDARLTNVSTPMAMLDGIATKASKEHTIAVLQQKERNVEKHTTKKREERRDALHTLYMNARSFITTEEQLLAEIDKEFSPSKWSSKYSGILDGKERNIWFEGEPQTVAEMLLVHGARPRKDSLNDISRKVEKDQERMKRIAETLSGGKM